MSTPSQVPMIDEQQEAGIADYLTQHPDFFTRHEDVLTHIDIPHQQGESVSLVERQVRRLREQNHQYRTRLDELVGVARENDEIARRLHRLTLMLIETRSFDELLNNLLDEMRGLLDADSVELKLFSRQELDVHTNEPGPAMLRDFLKQGHPACGQLSKPQLDYIFGSETDETGSVAMIPVQSGTLKGVLAISSCDPERFSENKRVDFLQRLAEVINATLGAVSGPGD